MEFSLAAIEISFKKSCPKNEDEIREEKDILKSVKRRKPSSPTVCESARELKPPRAPRRRYRCKSNPRPIKSADVVPPLLQLPPLEFPIFSIFDNSEDAQKDCQ
eukprot:TRINITY_DN9233_c0_g1_i3.p1 TRINITY_DN9233_c0_g1~~TRINITY_DN9233_c0_g1_i3.p1  ORF type:complete len:104 (+),score=13.12 TRINITY_DN9233_c0_g1_i3:191-502(+)